MPLFGSAGVKAARKYVVEIDLECSSSFLFYGRVHGGGSSAGSARSGTDLASLLEPLGPYVEPLPPTRLRSCARPDSLTLLLARLSRHSLRCVCVCADSSLAFDVEQEVSGRRSRRGEEKENLFYFSLSLSLSLSPSLFYLSLSLSHSSATSRVKKLEKKKKILFSLLWRLSSR